MYYVIGDSKLGQFRLGNRERHSIVALCSVVIVSLVAVAAFQFGSSPDQLETEVVRAEPLQPTEGLGTPESGGDDSSDPGAIQVFSAQVTSSTSTTTTTRRPVVTLAPKPPESTTVPDPSDPDPTDPPDETTIGDTTIPDPDPLPTITRPTITFPTITLPDPDPTVTISIPDPDPLPTISLPGPGPTKPWPRPTLPPEPLPLPTVPPEILPPDVLRLNVG